jgi:hypothetical protein
LQPTRRGKNAQSEEPVNAMRAQLYAQLMDAQEEIAYALYKRGVSNDVVLAALDSVDENLSEEQRREDLYLSALAHYLEALDGRLEVRAVFGDEEIVVRREPDEPK